MLFRSQGQLGLLAELRLLTQSMPLAVAAASEERRHPVPVLEGLAALAGVVRQHSVCPVARAKLLKSTAAEINMVAETAARPFLAARAEVEARRRFREALVVREAPTQEQAAAVPHPLNMPFRGLVEVLVNTLN